MGKFKPFVSNTTGLGDDLRVGAPALVPAPRQKKSAASPASPGDNSEKILKAIRNAVEQIVRRTRGTTCRLALWPNGILEVVNGSPAAGSNIEDLPQARGTALQDGSLECTKVWNRVLLELDPTAPPKKTVVEARMKQGRPVVRFKPKQ